MENLFGTKIRSLRETLSNGLKESNQQLTNYGSGFILAGGAVSFIGWCISIDLNLESNRVLKQSSLNRNYSE